MDPLLQAAHGFPFRGDPYPHSFEADLPVPTDSVYAHGEGHPLAKHFIVNLVHKNGDAEMQSGRPLLGRLAFGFPRSVLGNRTPDFGPSWVGAIGERAGV